jgi:hypothetical protein
MKTIITATFAESKQIVREATRNNEIDEICEEFFAQGAIAVNVRPEGVV